MSLINDVLKDLERRHAKAPDASPRPPACPGSVRVSRLRQWPLWLLAAVVLGLILHLTLDAPTPDNRADRSLALTAQADARPEPVPTPAPADRDPDRVPPSAPHGTASNATRHQATVPPPATTAPARDRQDEESEAAEQHDAETPGRGEESAERIQNRIQPHEETPAQTTSAPPRPAITSNAGPDADQSQGEQATISIRRAQDNAGSSDPLEAAKRLLARGQLQRAESRLRQIVSEQPGRTEAHELLATTLVHRRRPGAAIEALEAGLGRAREPAPLAALLGRMLLERGEVVRARAVLEDNAPPLAEAADYHLLLAAAHRQAGDHPQAAEHYRRLTEALPRRGAAWIGLGVSLEALDRPEDAVNAYNRALEGDDARAARFARERLAVLAPLTGASQ